MYIEKLARYSSFSETMPKIIIKIKFWQMTTTSNDIGTWGQVVKKVTAIGT